MAVSRIFRVSRESAFEAQGVKLTDASRSWSGVRTHDGAVVLAMRAADVQVDDHGCSCLLWAPALEGAAAWADRPSRQERLEHCRLAVRHGGAEGLILYGDEAAADADDVLSLRVLKMGSEYWAKWGAVTRAEDPGRFAAPRLRACLAA